MTQIDIGGQGGEDEEDGKHRRPGRRRDLAMTRSSSMPRTRYSMRRATPG